MALSLDEREEIRAGLVRGESCAMVAVRLGRVSSTISREVARNGGREGYRAVAAHQRAQRKRRRPKTFKLLAERALAKEVDKFLHVGFSPAAIAARLRQQQGPRVCAETIYQAVYARRFRGLTVLGNHCLRTRRRARRSRSHRAALAGRPRGLGFNFKIIHRRPSTVADRQEPGHWEGDLLTGRFNQSAIVTLVERTTRYIGLGYLDGPHDADAVGHALGTFFADVPEHLRLTLTWDQGNEMSNWPTLEAATGLEVYFCDPRSPWQRGTNENTNRQLRFWFPKGTDVRQHGPRQLLRATTVLNNQPRRLLHWNTPAQLYAAAQQCTDR